MIVVGSGKHVFDDYISAFIFLAKHQVGAVAADGCFGLCVSQVHAQCLSEEVGVLREPWREIFCLIGPELSNFHWRKRSDVIHFQLASHMLIRVRIDRNPGINVHFTFG